MNVTSFHRCVRLFAAFLLTLLCSYPLWAANVTVNGTVNFSSLDGSPDDEDHLANGVFTVSGDLVVNGTILCIDDGGRESACPMAFAAGHDVVINAGGAIYAENRTGTGSGAPIVFTVGHNFVMHGATTTLAAAIISTDSSSSNGSSGGNITANVSGDVSIEPGATIDSGSSNAAAGAISIVAGGHLDASGNVLAGSSRTILATRLNGAALSGGTANQSGGAITLKSTSMQQPALTIGSNANIVSQGQAVGAGPVLLEGCGIVVDGLVASLAYKDLPSRVVLRSGKTITIDARDLGVASATLGRNGMLRGDAPTGTALNHKIDVFAAGDISILGPDPAASANYAISGTPGVHDSKSDGADVTVVSLTGGITASGNVMVDGHTASGDDGGDSNFLARGDVNFDHAVLASVGDSSTSNPARGGGTINVRSYSGNVIWTNGTGDVRPTGSSSGLATSAQGAISLMACGTISISGSTFPTNGPAVGVFPGQITNACAPAAPSLPAGEPALPVCCNVITITNPAITTGTAGVAFSQTFTQTGGIGTVTWTESGALPAGMTLDSSTGILSGTPTQTGTFPIVVTVTDANGCSGSGATYNLTIACQTITVTNPATATGTANSAFSVTFTQTGGIGTTTFSTTSTLPGGLALSAAGVLSGTPTQTGTFSIAVKATDANGCSGTSTYTLTIGCQTITVTNPSVNSGTVNAPFTVAFAAANTIGTTTFTTASALPAGLALSPGGVLSGTPAQPGTFTIVVTATDANGCSGNGAAYTLTIACQTISVTNPPNNTGTAGQPFNAAFAQSGAIGTVTWSESGALPVNLTFNPSTGVLSGTTTQSGSFTITVTATDANGCSGSSTYTFTINCQSITITNPVNNTVTAGQPFNATFTASGILGTATWSESGALPSGITLSSSTGVLAGTSSQAGSFPITVTVTDSNGCSASSTFTLTVDCQSITVSNPGVSNFTVDAPVNVTFTASGILGTATFTVAGGSLPAGLTLSSTGVLSGSPQVPGTFSITVRATDSNACFGTSATYTLVVSCQSISVTNPAANTGSYNAPLTGSFTFTQTGVGTHTPAVFTVDSGSLPAGVTLTAAGALSGSPQQTGTFTFNVRVTDANGCSGVGAPYTLRVGPNVAAKAYTTVGNTQLDGGVAAPSTPTVIASPLFTGDTSDTTIIYAVTVPPSHGTLTVFTSNGTFLYTPDAGNTAADSFGYVATSNGVSTFATATIGFAGKVWYVDNATAASTNDGRSNTPFTTMTAAAPAAASGDIIYVSAGSGPTVGAFAMLSNETLIGGGATLSVGGVLNVPGAPANTPTLSGTLTLASNVSVAGIDMSTGVADAVVGTGVSGVNVTARNITTSLGHILSIGGTGNSGTITFTQVNSGVLTGPASAIAISNFAGSFTVTGDGGPSANGSGGTISVTTGDAVSLTNITGAGVSLNYVNITDSGLDGIRATSVNNLTINRCNITDHFGNALTDDGVGLVNMTGALTLTNDTIAGSRHQGLSLDNLNTNLASLTITGTTISGTAGGDGALLQTRGTSILTAGTVSGSTFSNNASTGLQVIGSDTSNIASLTLQNNTVSGNNAGFDLDLQQAASMHVDVVTNTFTNQRSQALNLFTSSASTGGVIRARLQGNLIGTAGVFDSGSFIGDGIRVALGGGTQGLLTIDGNVIREVANARGIDVDAQAYAAGNSVSVKITNNQVVRPSGTNANIGCGAGVPCPLASIAVAVDKNAAATESVCTVITGNTAYDPTSWPAGSESAFYLARRSLQTFNLEGNTALTPAQNVLGNNTVTNLTNPGFGDFTDESGNVVVVAPGTCGVFP